MPVASASTAKVMSSARRTGDSRWSVGRPPCTGIVDGGMRYMGEEGRPHTGSFALRDDGGAELTCG